MHPILFGNNIIIILFSIIILQITVIVLCGTWDNCLHWHCSLHPDNSQLIYFLVGYCSYFSDRKQKIHLSLSCFFSSLLDRKHRIDPLSFCFLSSLFQLCTTDTVLFQLCTMYTALFQFCTMYTVLFQLCTTDTVLIFFLAVFSLWVLQGNVDVLQYGRNMFSVYGIEVGWYLFLFQLCTIDTALCFSLQLFHYIYCKAIWMSSSMVVTVLACMV